MEYFIQNLLPIIVLIAAFTVGSYTALLLYRFYSNKKEAYIQSLFYHQIFLLIFGIYGLVGSALMSNFLLKYYINLEIIKKIISIIFYMAYPFIITGVFMLLKAGLELLGKQIKTLWVISYFFIMIVLSIVFAFTIDRILVNYNFEYFLSSKYLLFLFFEFILILFFGFYSLRLLFMKKFSSYKKAVFIYYFFFHILISMLFLFSNHFNLARIYFVLLYFAGNIFLIYLIPKIQISLPTVNTNNLDELFEKFGITNREKEIINEICIGKTNQEIADTLFISLQTVKDHIHNIFRKVDVKNRIQLCNIFS